YVSTVEAVDVHSLSCRPVIGERKPRKSLPKAAVQILRTWLVKNCIHPYPSEAQKALLVEQTGLTNTQICNWFINARRRVWPHIVSENGLPAAQCGNHQEGEQTETPPHCPNPNVEEQAPSPSSSTDVPSHVMVSSTLLLLASVSLNPSPPLPGTTEENEQWEILLKQTVNPPEQVYQPPALAPTQNTDLPEKVSKLLILAQVATEYMERLEKEEAEFHNHLPDGNQSC
uniref:Homeobox domain-containing protein n=1 Tax=Leptobrachium leishanense TaxID=445787 RepID=A0A8C5R9Q5_9ANUR